MMLDVGWNMLMMGMSRLQNRVVGMSLRIVPVELLIITINRVAVMPNECFGSEIESFRNLQTDMIEKSNAPTNQQLNLPRRCRTKLEDLRCGEEGWMP